MAEREAAVRLTLRAGAFVGGLNHVQSQVARVGSKMGRALSVPLMAGLKGAKAAAVGLGNSIKSTLSSAASFGGAFAVGAAAKKGLELQQTYANIAFNLSKASGEARTWQDIQKSIEPIALKTSRSSGEMADAFAAVFEATGDADYAAASLETIGQTANATGYSVEQLANAAQLMQRKFGASKEEIPEMMARFVEKVGVGGAGIDGLGNKFALMAGEAAAAGLKGKDGLSTLLGVMVALDSRVGEKSAPAMKMLLQTLKDGSSQLQAIQKASGLKFDKGSSAFDKMRKLLSGKGRAAIESKLEVDTRVVFDELAKPFDEAFKAAKESGASTKDATKAGLAAFDEAMATAGKSQLTAGKIAEESAKRAEDPQRKMALAMEKFTQEFTKPEILNATKELAKSLPKLAQGMAKLVEFTANNPLLAAGGFAGMKIGGGFLGGATQNLAVSGTKKAGAQLAGMFAAEVAKNGKWGAIGKSVGAAAGIAVAAYVAYELGKKAIDATLGESIKDEGTLRDARFNAASVARSGTQEEKAKALATLRAQIKKAEQDGPGVVNTVFGGLAHVASGGDVKTAGQRHEDMLAKARADAKALAESMGKGGDKVGAALEKGAAAMNAAADKMGKVGGGSGGNGLPAPPGNAPGYER